MIFLLIILTFFGFFTCRDDVEQEIAAMALEANGGKSGATEVEDHPAPKKKVPQNA